MRPAWVCASYEAAHLKEQDPRNNVSGHRAAKDSFGFQFAVDALSEIVRATLTSVQRTLLVRFWRERGQPPIADLSELIFRQARFEDFEIRWKNDQPRLPIVQC